MSVCQGERKIVAPNAIIQAEVGWKNIARRLKCELITKKNRISCGNSGGGVWQDKFYLTHFLHLVVCA